MVDSEIRPFDPTSPIRPKETVLYRLPASSSPVAAAAGMIAMLFAALAMLTRFPVWSWLALLLSLCSVNNTKTLEERKENGMYSGWSCVAFAFTSLLTVMMPVLAGQQTKAGGIPFGWMKGTIPVEL